MQIKSLAKLALIGAMLLGASVAQAAENQADWTTTLSVKLALLDKLGADSLHVAVESEGSAVMLTGTVDKRETMELAATIAKSVDGVKTVKNDIRLEATVANPSKSGAAVTEAEVKDAMLETRLRLALVNKMGSDGFKIGTEAASGVVTLEFDRGLANSRRKEAIGVAKGVDGVSKVVSVEKK